MKTIVEYMDEVAQKQRPETRLVPAVLGRAAEIFNAHAAATARMAIGEAVGEFEAAGLAWEEAKLMKLTRSHRLRTLEWNYMPPDQVGRTTQ